MDTDDLGAVPLAQRTMVGYRLREPPDLDAAINKRLEADNVVNDDRNSWIFLYVTELLGGTHVPTTDFNGVEVEIQLEDDRTYLRATARPYGGQPSQPLGLQVAELVAGEQDWPPLRAESP